MLGTQRGTAGRPCPRGGEEPGDGQLTRQLGGSGGSGTQPVSAEAVAAAGVWGGEGVDLQRSETGAGLGSPSLIFPLTQQVYF